MTWEVHRKTRRRYENLGHARFLTFSCRDRERFFDRPAFRDIFADQLVRSHARLRFGLYAWVVMPEHVHLLVRPVSVDLTVSKVLMSLKRPVATRALRVMRAEGGVVPDSFWQPGGGHDRNIFSKAEFAEKVDYIHMNPVKRGLVERPMDWAWSSWRTLHGRESRWDVIDRL